MVDIAELVRTWVGRMVADLLGLAVDARAARRDVAQVRVNLIDPAHAERSALLDGTRQAA
jgi:hypothetical protein